MSVEKNKNEKKYTYGKYIHTNTYTICIYGSEQALYDSGIMA